MLGDLCARVRENESENTHGMQTMKTILIVSDRIIMLLAEHFRVCILICRHIECAGLLVFLAERINDFCRTHWESFARQMYFDKSGTFISAVFSAPLTFMLLIILVLQLIETAQTLITAKRAEIRYKQRMRRREEEADTRADAAAGGDGTAGGERANDMGAASSPEPQSETEDKKDR